MALFKKISLSKIDPTQVKDNTAGFLSEAGQRLGGSILKQAKEKFEQEQQAKRLAMQKQIAAMQEAGANARNAATLANNLAIHGTYGQRAADAKAASDTSFQHQKELNGTFDEKMAFKEKDLAARVNMAQQKLLAAKAEADAAEARKAQEKLDQLALEDQVLKGTKILTAYTNGYRNATTPEEIDAISSSFDGAIAGLDRRVATPLLASLQKESVRNSDNTTKEKIAESQAKENIAKIEQDANANKNKNAKEFSYKILNLSKDKNGNIDFDKVDKILKMSNKIANGELY